MLTNSARFMADTNFEQLQPQYNITAKEIGEYLQTQILKTEA